MATSRSEPPVPPEVIAVAVALALTESAASAPPPQGEQDVRSWRWVELEPTDRRRWSG